VFGVTTNRPNTEERAVRSALDMLQRLESIQLAESEKIEMGVGVNSGVAMAGYVGTDERVEFTVLGDIVNVAQRLQLHARPNRVLIGPGTYQIFSAQNAGRFIINPVGQLEIKGRVQAVDAYEVLRA
jgi:adenylate cyclase